MNFRHPLAAALLITTCLLSACAGVMGPRLVPGQSTIADVEASLGRPAEKLALPDGDSVWYFTSGQRGETLAVQIGANGVVHSVEQRLTERNIQRIRVGSTTAKDVRALLGPPGKSGPTGPQNRQQWEYQITMGIDHKVLTVVYSPDGIVRDLFLQVDHSLFDDSGGFM